MVSFAAWLDSLVAIGYNQPKARSKIAHDVVNKDRLMSMLRIFIIDNPEMRENDIASIMARLSRTFQSRTYMQKLRQTEANWLGILPQAATRRVLAFLRVLGETR